MSADDERDPLDRWLHETVRPLAPPPGTFDLIRKRARRRKMGSLALSLALGAAAAGAVFALAVPGRVLLQLSPAKVPATALANGGQTQPGGGTEAPDGTASKQLTPSPGATASAPVTVPSGPVPANFAPTSVTFVSDSEGWVIGQAGTPGSCANKNPYICTSVARTDNAGKTWTGSSAPDTSGPDGPAGVSQIRFLDGVNGWAFGPELWATHDAGQQWTQVATDGYRVTDLETAGDRAFALWAQCLGAAASGPDVASGCTSYTLMSAAAGSNDWTPVGGATSGMTDGGNPTSAELELTGTTGYLLAPDGAVYSGPVTGGAWQQAGTADCQPGTPQADGLPAHAFLALFSATDIAVACDSSSSAAGPLLYTSTDGGQLWQQLPDIAQSGLSDVGTPTSLAAIGTDGTLVLATTGGIYLLPAGYAQWKATTVSGALGPPGGFTYVGMTTATQGVAVPADTSLHEIWLTYNGGQSWTPSAPIAPGN